MARPQTRGLAPPGGAIIPTVSFAEGIQYALQQVLPSYTQGLFTRNQRWVSFWARVHPDPFGVRLISAWRRKYGAACVYVPVLGRKSLLVLDATAIAHVLENSPHVYADPKLKRKGMGHFQPDALTLSRGDSWRARRRFNEAVLDAGASSGEYAERFLDIVRSETATCVERTGAALAWPDIQRLFDRITLRVVFGDAARDDDALLGALKALMLESNRVVGLKRSPQLAALHTRIQSYLAAPGAGSLAALCATAGADDDTKVEGQIPHWLFAMDETLAANTARALALIATHPDAAARVRREVESADLSTPEGIHALKYVEACIQEAMRLWPTTPLLAREAIVPDTLSGMTVPAGTQVLIPSGFLHRDPELIPFADAFTPDFWVGEGRAHRFYHFSSGAQVCPGAPLALFIAKAVVATLLAGARYTLRRPPLDPSRPLPHAYDYFKLVLSREKSP